MYTWLGRFLALCVIVACFSVVASFPRLVFAFGKNSAITAAMVVDIVSDDRCVFVVAV